MSRDDVECWDHVRCPSVTLLWGARMLGALRGSVSGRGRAGSLFLCGNECNKDGQRRRRRRDLTHTHWREMFRVRGERAAETNPPSLSRQARPFRDNTGTPELSSALPTPRTPGSESDGDPSLHPRHHQGAAGVLRGNGKRQSPAHCPERWPITCLAIEGVNASQSVERSGRGDVES